MDNSLEPIHEIKITKWYKKVCSACSNYFRDFGDYDNVEWNECRENKKLLNLKCFPLCNAISCDRFNPKEVFELENDYWSMIGRMDKLKWGLKRESNFVWNILQFNERLGCYKSGIVQYEAKTNER